MKLTKSCSLVAFFGALLLISCADSREQYKSKSASDLKPQSASSGRLDELYPDLFEMPKVSAKLKDDSPKTRAALSERTRRNSLKPIVYGQGAAGIDFNTTIDEATLKLETDVGPLEDGRHGFHEEIIVIWNQNNPRTPEMIVVDSEYLGGLEVPGAMGGVIRLKQELNQFFPDSDPEGEEFVRSLFNHYEKQAVDDDCLASGRCLILANKETIVFYLPGMRLYFTNDKRNSLLQVRVLPGRDPLNLAGQFDLISGSIETRDSGSIGLGMSFEEVRRRSGIEQEIERLRSSDSLRDPEAYDRYTVLFDGFKQSYDGMTLIYEKSKFDRAYQLPDPLEALKFIRFSPGLASHQMLFAGQRAWVVRKPEQKIEVILGDRPQVPDIEPVDVVMPLTNQMVPLRAERVSQKNLMRQLVQKTSEVLSRNPKLSVSSRIIGLEDDRRSNTLKAHIHAFSSDKTEAPKTYSFVSDLRGMSLNAEVILQTSPFARKVIENQDTKVGEGKLLGFELGQKVQLQNEDLGKGEADLVTVGKSIKGRVGISKNETASVNELIRDQMKKTWIQVNVISLFINGLEIQTQKHGDSEVIVSLAGAPNGEISNICGDSTLKTRVGASASLFLENLKTTIDAKGLRCKFVQNTSGASDGRVTSVDFPGDGFSIVFSRNEVSAVRAYLDQQKGLKALGGELQ